MSVVALVLIVLCWIYKRSGYIICASVSYLIHAITLDLLTLGILDTQMDYGNVAAYSFEFFYSFAMVSCALIVLASFLKYGNDCYQKPMYSKRIVRLGYIFLSISFIALLINVDRAGGVGLMFIDSRLYELTFGDSVFLNYLYFLHLPAALLFVVAYISSGNSLYFLLIIVSIILSVFHGIKFTIIHAFLYPMLFYWIYSGYRINKFIVIGSCSLVAIIVIYFNEVRGDIDGLLGYLTSSSMNALFLLSKVDVVINTPVGVVFPDFEFFFQKLLDRVFSVPIESSLHDPFVLNEKYNLVPSWYLASMVGLPSYLFVIGLLCVVISFVRRHYYPNVGRAVIEAHIYFTLLLSFQGWPLFTLKMMYVILVMLLCFPLSRVKKNAKFV
jgi:hypothetical protein